MPCHDVTWYDKQGKIDRTPSFYTSRSILNISGLSVSDRIPLIPIVQQGMDDHIHIMILSAYHTVNILLLFFIRMIHRSSFFLCWNIICLTRFNSILIYSFLQLYLASISTISPLPLPPTHTHTHMPTVTKDKDKGKEKEIKNGTNGHKSSSAAPKKGAQAAQEHSLSAPISEVSQSVSPSKRIMSYKW